MSGLARLLLLAVVASVANGAAIESRILGSSFAEDNEFPWQVSLRRTNGEHFCGGSLISTTKVLTSAYCVEDLTTADVSVITGTNSLTSGGESHAVSKIVYHANFTGTRDSSLRYDIAIITLAKPAHISSAQRPIALASSYLTESEEAVTTGWGSTLLPSFILPSLLQKHVLSIKSNEYCENLHTSSIYADQICAGANQILGACGSDRGGPLVVDDELVGITSWGLYCALGIPDVYTRVYPYLDWIVDNTEDSVA